MKIERFEDKKSSIRPEVEKMGSFEVVEYIIR